MFISYVILIFVLLLKPDDSSCVNYVYSVPVADEFEPGTSGIWQLIVLVPMVLEYFAMIGCRSFFFGKIYCSLVLPCFG